MSISTRIPYLLHLIVKVLPASLIFICGLSGAWAQDQSRETLIAKIKVTEKLLAETVNRSERTLSELTILDRQIKYREQLIYILNQEILQISEDVNRISLSIDKTLEGVASLKRAYIETVNYTYRSFNEDNFLLSVLSANNVSQAYYRGMYFSQFSRFRKKQIASLLKAYQKMNQDRMAMLGLIEEKRRHIDQKEAETGALLQAHMDKSRYANLLELQKKRLNENLGIDKNALLELVQRIEEKFALTPEFVEKSDVGELFVKGQGYHYWPIPLGNGILVSRYGTTKDEYGNQVENQGIFIRTPIKQKIRSIFQGVVSGVSSIPHSGKVVIIQHGEYRTIYAQLEEVFVKKGDTVGSKTEIGIVRTDPRTDETVLGFMVYKKPNAFLNPEDWIFVE